MSKHSEFILTPIESILEEVPIALKNVKIGFDTFGLYEYVMQSVFLKMTGFQEQKMKCVCWELATEDYEYRYKRFKREPLGECSELNEKNKVWNDLVEHVLEYDSSLTILEDSEKTRIMDETKDVIRKFYIEGNLEGWAQKDFYVYTSLIANCAKECLCFKSKRSCDLFSHCENCSRKERPEAENTLCKTGTLSEAYLVLFKHRNRCAHNTHSYQHNLPSLQTMSGIEYVCENYFLHFALLIMIDKMIVCLFEKYQELSNADFKL